MITLDYLKEQLKAFEADFAEGRKNLAEIQTTLMRLDGAIAVTKHMIEDEESKAEEVIPTE